MAFDKPDRYETPTALAEDVERFLAGAATTAYKEPLVTRFGRWLRRHRRGILRSITIIGILFLSSVAAQSYRQARMLARREQARETLAKFYRLTDEAQFYAANTDAISERVPYFDPQRAQNAGAAALAIAIPWGETAQELP